MVLRIPQLLLSKAALSSVLLKAHHSSIVLSTVPFCTLTCHPNGLDSFPTIAKLFLNATLKSLILFLAFLCDWWPSRFRLSAHLTTEVEAEGKCHMNFLVKHLKCNTKKYLLEKRCLLSTSFPFPCHNCSGQPSRLNSLYRNFLCVISNTLLNVYNINIQKNKNLF